MGKLSYESQGTNNYLLYQLDLEEKLDSISLGMITNNRIPGLAAASFVQMDSERYIKYQVFSKEKASKFLKGKVTRKGLVEFFLGITQAVISIEDYMIAPDTIVLDMDYIFVDTQSYETALICLPVLTEEEEQKMIQWDRFFKNIMFNVQFDGKENGDYVTQMLNYLNSNAVFCLNDFQIFLKSLKMQTISDDKEKANGQGVGEKNRKKDEIEDGGNQSIPIRGLSQKNLEMCNRVNTINEGKTDKVDKADKSDKKNKNTQPSMSLFYLLQHYNKENAKIYKSQQDRKKKEQQKKKEAKGKNQVSFAVPGQNLSDGNRAVALVSNSENLGVKMSQSELIQSGSLSAGFATEEMGASIYRVETGDTVEILATPFRIGRLDDGSNDYAMSDNKKISGNHIEIREGRDGYYLYVNKSKNGTHINGSNNLPIGQSFKLEDGDIITIANEKLEFHTSI